VKPSTLLALILLFTAALLQRHAEVSPVPGPAWQQRVAPVRQAVAGHPADGRRLAALYMALADLIERDQGRVITTAGQFRALHARAGVLLFQGRPPDYYPGLAQQIDRLLAEALRLERTKDGWADAPLDKDRLAALIEALRALAWACSP